MKGLLLRTMKCGLVAAVFVAAISAQAQETSGLRGIAVSPVMFRTQARAGVPVNLQLQVENLEPGAVRATIKIRAAQYSDWSYAPQLDESHPRDCSGWFSDRTVSQSVKGNATFNFNMKALVPKQASGVYWCLATLDPIFPGDRSPISAQYQIPIILFVGTQPKPDLRFLTPTLQVDKNGGGVVEVPFENVGDGFTVIGSAIQMRDAVSGRVITGRADQDRNLYPHSKRSLRFNIGRVPDGQYEVVSRSQAGARVFRPLTSAFVVNNSKAQPLTARSVIGLAPFALNPDRIRLQMPAGAEKAVGLRIQNTSDRPIKLELTPRHLRQTQNGGFELGEDMYTGATKISITPKEITIPARRAGTARIMLSVPDGARGDQWFGIAARQVDGNSMNEEIYGSIIVPKTGKPNLVVRQVELDKLRNVPISLTYEVENSGNMALLPVIGARVLLQGLTPVAEIEVPKQGDGGILPGTILRNKIMLPPGLKPGAYALVVSYQYGEADFARLTVPFNVPKAPPAKGGKGK